MKISHRLYLTVMPAVLAVLLLASLAYWGQYAHTAPGFVLVVGAIAAVLSLVLTWSNARYVARRLERIVGGPTTQGINRTSLRGVASATTPGAPPGPPDEIDEIESVVDRLSSAVQVAEGRSADREMLFERRAHDYALLLASIADASTKRLDEVRLPLHILLDNHFGDLNENQEEMLGAARAAAEAVDADMVSLRQIAAFDLGERPLRQDRVKPSDVIDSLRPLLKAAAEGSGVTLQIEVAPLLPPLLGDRSLLQDALSTILRDSIAASRHGARVGIDVDREGQAIRMLVQCAGTPTSSVRWAGAVRVVQAHAGSVSREADALRIRLPLPVVN